METSIGDLINRLIDIKRVLDKVHNDEWLILRKEVDEIIKQTNELWKTKK